MMDEVSIYEANEEQRRCKREKEDTEIAITFKPSTKPGPRNDLEDVRLALSKLDLKTSGRPSLEGKF